MAFDKSIFAPDPDAPAKPEYERPEYAFQLRGGLKSGKKGVSLAKWRILAAGEDNAKAIAELLGGKPTLFDAAKEHDYEVLTEASSIEVVIAGAEAIEDKFIQWGANGLPVHECDGLRSLLKEDKGELCGCSGTLKERKAKARKGTGPGPGIVVTLRLAGLGYELGLIKWIATSWQFAETTADVKDALDDVEGEALATLEIVHCEFTDQEGDLVKYKKPVITVQGSYADAVAEDR